ncbi:DUF72 domain-containing protein [Aureibacillus halotolerans]|uniref:Uncharacterized protein YecE (DUF72 family) n=1 Tax=Aureibacillus halotolerans TaxID=1508390 RepID=A0A4R6U6V9_9BACI|nr:DUF72 domain-containing protein [Aureibacillus halotolerans]TDQ40449.1 uncharacterized protein YecE (DUF72 family) [Aureibacillus halotolerans]
MIYVGVTGWGDHDALYEKTPASEKLEAYSSHFPVVEVDSSFYAIQPQKNYLRWLEQTPETFRFIVKLFQQMTGHIRGEGPFQSIDELYDAYVHSIEPMRSSGRLGALLCQFPPWFNCTSTNVAILKDMKMRLEGFPLALEFRHTSWFQEGMREKTLQFMTKEGWMNSVCDEPQAGDGSIPPVPVTTSKEANVLRFHGRNVEGWRRQGRSREEWRKVRCLYRYTPQELKEWVPIVQRMAEESNDVYVLFNNNSAGDAVPNAKQFIEMLGLDQSALLAPKQLTLFD